LLLALAGGSCRREKALLFHSAPIILISIDTLRADHLPAYGYKGVDTPNLDALRNDSVLFANAYCHVPLTLPSHVSLFTGRIPPQNGVRDNLGYRLGPEAETLASFLKQRGYATGGAVSSVVLSHSTGIQRGFDFYDDDVEPTAINQSLGRVQRNGAVTAERLRDWIAGIAERPFLAFLHLFEPHTPYEPPEPYKSRYRHPYDGEVARADEIVGDFLKMLKQKGIYDRSILVFLSDHGEGLNDHGEEEHGILLYRDTLHVPLFVKLPGSRLAGQTVAEPVTLTDVFPTLAALIGAPFPQGISGVSLAPRLGGAPLAIRRVYSETIYPRLHLGWSDLASLIDDRHHYIEAPRPELYDFLADPGEKRDLAPGLPPAFRAMRLALSGIPRAIQAPGVSDPEQVRKLAALGYIGATSSDLESKDLPDPKDRIEAVEMLKTGFGHLQADRYAEAARIFRELLEKNPRMTDVWQLLAQAYTKLGRDREALAALEESARLSPGNPQVLLALAEYYLEVGKYDQARRHAELARDAGAANAHENLAKIAVAQRDLATAEREAQAALQEYPNRRIPRLILGRVKRERGDLAGALVELEHARRLSQKEGQPPLYNLNFLRADVLARLGREGEAETAFRDELRDFPASPSAWTGLALLYASQGREGEARQALEELVKKAHTPEAFFAAIRTYEILGDSESAAAVRTRLHRLFPSARDRRGSTG
jgi:tetratricopeptide (TPR) repeat protein